MEVFTGRMQAALTLLLVCAFIVLLWFKPEAADALKEFVGLAVTFWLLRQRTGTGSDTPAPKPAPQPEAPPAPP